MIRYLSLPEILDLHQAIIVLSGGSSGIRDIQALESAMAQPRVTFNGNDLYPDFIAKAAILCFSIVMNHPFLDGNKRVGHAAMETFLFLNGMEIKAPVDEQERIMLDLAAGELTRESFTDWVRKHALYLVAER